MTDRKGNELSVGDRVFVLAHKPGGPGRIVAISNHGMNSSKMSGVRVISDDAKTTWSVFCHPREVEKI